MTVYVFLVVITLFSYVFCRYRYIDKVRYYSHSIDNYDFNVAYETVERKTIGVFFTVYIVRLCLRGSLVGNDTARYIRVYFDNFKYLSFFNVVQNTTDELGFSIFAKIISLITNSPQVFLSVIAIVSVAPIMYLYRKEGKDALFCCSFFMISLLFEAYFSALREGVATLIEVKCSIGARDDLGRPTTTALENKQNFMGYLGTL